MTGPYWNTPAKLDGLPATNWKKRTGATLEGMVATCIERWLGQPSQERFAEMVNLKTPWRPDPPSTGRFMSFIYIGTGYKNKNDG